MNIASAVILGAVQGLTEFLPVSSSGHLVIIQSLFHNFKQPGISFDIFIHLATLLAVIVYFHREIADILTFRNVKWIFLIIVGTVPAGVIGVLFKDRIELMFSNVTFVCYMLIITGVLLFLSDRCSNLTKSKGEITFFDAIVIGVFQAFAIIPGISRSGSTIAAGIFRGISRDAATKFSFILSIPAITGAFLLSLKDFTKLTHADYIPYLAGFGAAFIVGLLSLKMLTLIIKTRNLKFFSFYCWILAGVILSKSII
jgi:undecaprenyl-diphosphatase